MTADYYTGWLWRNDLMQKAVFCILVTIITAVSCLAEDEQKLYLVSVDEKFGFINNKGEVVIKPQYESAYSFSDGLALVKKGAFWGYIDTQGILEIKPIFLSVGSFKEGRALVVKQNHSPCVIDNTGKVIFSLEKGQILYDYQEGRAATMRLSDRKWGFVDSNGKFVVDYKYEECKFTFSFSSHISELYPYVFLDGRAPVCLNGKYGFIDINGKPITDCIYDDVRYFQYGLTVVGLSGKSGLIDKSGNYILPLEFDKIGQVTESYISVSKNGKWGYVDHSGSLVIPYQYDAADSFRAERGKVGIKASAGSLKYGYIDKAGKQIVNPSYDNAYTYDSKGYAIVEVGDRSGVIDEDGKYLIPLLENIKFDPLEGYQPDDYQKLYYRDYVQDGAIIYYDVRTKKKGFMGVNGKKITAPIYFMVEPFKDGIAMVKLGSDYNTAKTGYIDMTGKYIWKPSR